MCNNGYLHTYNSLDNTHIKCMKTICVCRNFLENALFKDSTNAACALRGTRPSSANEARFMPFGHGAKMCVGYSLADVEMKMLLACWVATFRSTGNQLFSDFRSTGNQSFSDFSYTIGCSDRCQILAAAISPRYQAGYFTGGH